jgi:hypothetical protein
MANTVKAVYIRHLEKPILPRCAEGVTEIKGVIAHKNAVPTAAMAPILAMPEIKLISKNDASKKL